MTNILLTLTVFLLSLSNLWLWMKVTDLESTVHTITDILVDAYKKAREYHD